jgi:hypothetical protein
MTQEFRFTFHIFLQNIAHGTTRDSRAMAWYSRWVALTPLQLLVLSDGADDLPAKQSAADLLFLRPSFPGAVLLLPF